MWLSVLFFFELIQYIIDVQCDKRFYSKWNFQLPTLVCEYISILASFNVHLVLFHGMHCKLWTNEWHILSRYGRSAFEIVVFFLRLLLNLLIHSTNAHSFVLLSSLLRFNNRMISNSQWTCMCLNVWSHMASFSISLRCQLQIHT